MPALSFVSSTDTSVTLYITGLTYKWDTAQYNNAYFAISGVGTSSAVYPPPPVGANYYTGNITKTGLTQNTSYTATGYVVTSAMATVNIGTYNFTTPGVPIGTPSISATAAAGKTINASWGSATNATGYNIYANDGIGSGDVLKISNTASTSGSFTVDKEYFNYTIKVVPINSYGNGSSNTTTVRTLDEHNPSVTGFSTGTITQNSIQVSATGTDNGAISPNLNSGMNGFYFYKDSVYDGVAYGSSVSYTYSGLTAGTSYDLTCYAFDVALNNSAASGTLTISTNSRPSNFSWSPALSAGNNPPTAAQWNAMTSKIDEFRAYKGLAAYGFTTASAGIFYYWQFNQAVNGLNALSSYMTNNVMPPIRASGDILYASELNNFVNSMNSIA